MTDLLAMRNGVQILFPNVLSSVHCAVDAIAYLSKDQAVILAGTHLVRLEREQLISPHCLTLDDHTIRYGLDFLPASRAKRLANAECGSRLPSH